MQSPYLAVSEVWIVLLQGNLQPGHDIVVQLSFYPFDHYSKRDSQADRGVGQDEQAQQYARKGG